MRGSGNGRNLAKRGVSAVMWTVVVSLLLVAAAPTLVEAQGRVMEVFVTNDSKTPVPVTGEVSVVGQAAPQAPSPYQFADLVSHDSTQRHECTPIEPPEGTVLEVRTIHVQGRASNVDNISLVWRVGPTTQVDYIPLDGSSEGRWEVPFFVTETDQFVWPHTVSICTLKSNEAPLVLHYIISGFVHQAS